ncbi:MAG: HD domain-containing phosphohydrolase [Candidatus Cloacimonadales bacterium]
MGKISFDLNQFLQAVSFAIDFVEMDILQASRNHSKRVAYIALCLAENLGLSEAERSDIIVFSIMHDSGLCEESLLSNQDFRKLRQLRRMETFSQHCEFGEKNIAAYPLRSKASNIIKYHHENWDGSGFFGLAGKQIPLLAQIIGMADFVDNLFHFETGERQKIAKYLKYMSGKRFSPQIVEAYFQVSAHTRFWLDLKNEFIGYALQRKTIPNQQLLSWSEIYQIIEVFTTIIDSKSHFTGRHSKQIVAKTILACDYYQIEGDERIKLKIAAALHDLGKLAMPDKILEKASDLDRSEMRHMKTHTYYTKLALSLVDHFAGIKEWAGNHHEKLNGMGYPEGLKADQLSFKSRLLSCVDLYQALTEDRPYRPKMSPQKAFDIMQKMVKNGYIDQDIVENFIADLVQKDGADSPK